MTTKRVLTREEIHAWYVQTYGNNWHLSDDDLDHFRDGAAYAAGAARPCGDCGADDWIPGDYQCANCGSWVVELPDAAIGAAPTPKQDWEKSDGDQYYEKNMPELSIGAHHPQRGCCGDGQSGYPNL
ncbi:MAG: hypothetical protein MUO77_10375 [Anaerolineales bacterium]|nr:hypothetical protein [Anaerolineales bacterium]